MRPADAFRDPETTRRLVERIHAQVRALGRPARIMEICGGHTHAIFRYGLEGMLPEGLTLVHGPGCPVCVLPVGRVDDAVALARRPEVVLASYGDALRVPGSQGSLAEARATGADVRTVYSPADALRLARALPDRQVVFLALGFETTAPATAATVLRAAADGVPNFTVLSNHVLVPPALDALLSDPAQRLDGFVGPGHVSAVIGTAPYTFVAERHGRPVVVAGFEPVDVLQAVSMVLTQLVEGRAAVENAYARVVRPGGNPAARAAVDAVFEPRPTFEWRGLGALPRSGLQLRAAYATFDAERRFAVPGRSVADPKACRCAEVLRGVIEPRECKVFGTACTPQRPIGACMVSSEGACAAVYTYGRLRAGGRP